jgi:hypothetical protein
MTIEYRVRPIVRFLVTRHEIAEDGGSTQHIGSEYPNGDTAFEVAYALASAEAKRMNLSPGSMEMIYPQTPVTYRLEPNGPYGEMLVMDGRSPNPHVSDDVGRPA